MVHFNLTLYNFVSISCVRTQAPRISRSWLILSQTCEFSESLTGVSVVQSSLGHSQGDAEHAVDGNRDANYGKGSCTHTKAEFNPCDLGAAQNAVDGNRQSSYALGSCSVTNGDMNPWWRVDLLDVYRVTRVSITNRGDCCEKRIEGIQIRIGNSLENNGNNNEAAIVGPIPLGNTKIFEFKHVKGRYVNLIVPGRNEYLTLCEVEVYSENAALWGKTSQSSNYLQSGPELALDGLLTSWTHTNTETNPWWRVDLLKVYRVNRVTITNRPGNGLRINGAVIRIGNFLDIYKNRICAVISTLADGATATFSCGGMEGRYMIVHIPGDQKILSLSEAGVYGYLAGNSKKCLVKT
uniref:Fucolectin tachylectin-4 pentraxin-1 domain-containing protein n=1 Tax=Sinocyclocheilus rhinocerous TaxID=307959 RepID=A0A673GWR6_9TELE